MNQCCGSGSAWIRIKEKPRRLTNGAVEDHNGAVEDHNGAVEAHNGAMEAHNGAMEAHNGAVEVTMDTGRVCMHMVADSHHFDFDFSHQREKLVLTLS
jgi:hypothetical protein